MCINSLINFLPPDKNLTRNILGICALVIATIDLLAKENLKYKPE